METGCTARRDGEARSASGQRRVGPWRGPYATIIIIISSSSGCSCSSSSSSGGGGGSSSSSSMPLMSMRR